MYKILTISEIEIIPTEFFRIVLVGQLKRRNWWLCLWKNYYIIDSIKNN